MRPTLPQPTLMLVSDMARLQIDDPMEQLQHIVHEAIEGGVDVVQLREKQLSHEQRVTIGRRLRDAIASRSLLFINGDIDAAIELGADGVHLPAGTQEIAATRRRIGDSMLLSVSAHSIDEALRAEAVGADFLQIGTVFASTTHPGGATIGIDGISAICDAVRVPVIGIGGITATNAAEVMRAGATGVAVISAILDADNPRAASAELRDAISAPVRA